MTGLSRSRHSAEDMGGPASGSKISADLEEDDEEEDEEEEEDNEEEGADAWVDMDLDDEDYCRMVSAPMISASFL